MGAWYWIGVFAGLGAAIGVLVAGIVPRWLIAAAVAAVAGAAIGILVLHWDEGVAGAIGGIAGGFGATPVVAGSLRRGGTRGGLAAIVGLAAVCVSALAFVPVAGYLEVLALPVLALRVRRKTPERYAGLRTLARD
ncbi:MAG TPA: hypothetical protein VGM80_07075 [Gaiellaceae bacterium]